MMRPCATHSAATCGGEGAQQQGQPVVLISPTVSQAHDGCGWAAAGPCDAAAHPIPRCRLLTRCGVSTARAILQRRLQVRIRQQCRTPNSGVLAAKSYSPTMPPAQFRSAGYKLICADRAAHPILEYRAGCSTTIWGGIAGARVSTSGAAAMAPAFVLQRCPCRFTGTVLPGAARACPALGNKQ